MFNNLIESDSHKEDYKRRASFFIYTVAGYAVLMLAAGVASIYAYDAHLENQNVEYLVMVAPSMQPPPSVKSDVTPRAKAGAKDDRQLPERNDLIARIDDSTRPPDVVSAVGATTPEMPPGPFVLGNRNSDVSFFGSANDLPTSGYTDPSNSGRNIVKIEDKDTPPPLRIEPPPTPKKQVVNKGSLIASQAISLPKPPYPPIARAARAAGTVTVQILLDETGRVISARAVSGHPLLQQAAVKAAYQARFSPTMLTGQPVKVSGIITYNFTLQ